MQRAYGNIKNMNCTYQIVQHKLLSMAIFKKISLGKPIWIPLFYLKLAQRGQQ